MGRQPDEIIPLPDGNQERIHYRRRLGYDGCRTQTRILVNANGVKLRIIHEVIARDGRVVHQHELPIIKKDQHATSC